MAATTTLLGLVTPTQGTLSGTWGDTVNYGISDYVDISVAGTLTLTNDGAVTLANTTGSSSGNSITSSLTGAGTVTAQFAIVRVTGTLTTAKVVTAPSYSKTYTVVNAATGGIVTFKASGQTGVSVAVGESAFVYFNGTDYVKVSGTVAVASFQTSLGGLTPSTATTGVVTLAGTLNTTSGGTGLTSFTAGDVPYYASGSVLSKLAIGTAGQFLTSTGTAPQWSTLSGVAVTTFSAGTTGFTPSSATSGAVTLAGTLATTNGGTGLTSFTSGGVVYASSSSALATGSALTFDGTNLGIAGRMSITTTSSPNLQGQWGYNATGGTYIFAKAGSTQDFILYRSDGNSGLEMTAAGNLGFGVTPSAWDATGAGGPVLQIKRGLFFGANSETRLIHNAYYGTGDFRYIATDPATNYQQSSGQHRWYNAPSGTAGNVATFTQAMTLDASGNLGIGTTSPGSYAADADNLVVASSGNTGMTIKSGATSTGNLYFANAENSTSNNGVIEVDHNVLAMSFNIYGTGRSFRFKSAGTEVLRLDSAGNLGLGVTPSASTSNYRTLQIGDGANSYSMFGQRVAGASEGFMGWNVYGGSNTTTLGTGFYYRSTGDASTLYTQNAQHTWWNAASGTAGNAISFTQAMTLTAAGNLCIGTTSASVKLRVESTDADYISVFRNTNASGYGLQVLTQGSGTNLAFQVRTNAANTDAFQVLDNGRVGIGTNAPDSLLHILTPSSHTANVLIARTQNSTTYTSSVATIIGDRGTTDSTYNLINCYNNGTGNQLVVRDSGNVQNTNNSYGAISDVKLKENIVDASPKLADLMQVKVRSYNLKSGSAHKQLGVIAQELETVFPAMVEEAIDRDLEGNDLGTTTKSVKYSVFVPMLIKAMQEQQAIIESLTARLDAANL